MPFVNLRGLRHCYQTIGDGFPLLFIHGGTGGAASGFVDEAHPAKQAFGGGTVRTIAYDRRNCGRSEYTGQPYALGDLAADAAALLDNLGVSQAVIVGASAGGPVALEFALTRPERVTALVLLNTGPNLASDERVETPVWRHLVELTQAVGDAGAFDMVRAQDPSLPRLPPESLGDSGHPRRVIAAYEQPTLAHFTGVIRNYAAYLDVDYTNRLPELAMPTCIIHGIADLITPYHWAEKMQSLLPNSSLTTVPDFGHGILAAPEGLLAYRTWILAHL